MYREKGVVVRREEFALFLQLRAHEIFSKELRQNEDPFEMHYSVEIPQK